MHYLNHRSRLQLNMTKYICNVWLPVCDNTSFWEWFRYLMDTMHLPSVHAYGCTVIWPLRWCAAERVFPHFPTKLRRKKKQHCLFFYGDGQRSEKSQVPYKERWTNVFFYLCLLLASLSRGSNFSLLFKNSAGFPANSCLPKTTSTRPRGCVSVLLCRTDPLANYISQGLLTSALDGLAWRLLPFCIIPFYALFLMRS